MWRWCGEVSRTGKSRACARPGELENSEVASEVEVSTPEDQKVESKKLSEIGEVEVKWATLWNRDAVCTACKRPICAPRRTREKDTGTRVEASSKPVQKGTKVTIDETRAGLQAGIKLIVDTTD